MSDPVTTKAYVEKVRSAFLRAIQGLNKCPNTGSPCRPHTKCGFLLEMEAWIDGKN